MTSAVNPFLMSYIRSNPKNPTYRCALRTTHTTLCQTRRVSAALILPQTSSNHTAPQSGNSNRRLKKFCYSARAANSRYSGEYGFLSPINLHLSSLKDMSRSRNSFSTFTKSEYIHPLSQIVLEHLQSHHSEWLNRMGLERGLEVKKDGTFVLRFPRDGGAEHRKEYDQESIWTMYEPSEKKHYLCITKNKLIGRYLLQDNTKPAWHSDKKSTPEKVQDAVDEMVVKLEEMERS